jgi:chromosome segregation ATPase
LSKEDVSALIKSEIASRLEQYEQQLAAAKAESKRQKAELKVKEAEINSLRKEIAALQDQAKSPAHSTAASSPPDLPDPPDKLERWGCMREIREVTKKVGELERVLTKHVLGLERGTPFGTMGKGRGRCENGTSHGACRDI